VLLLALAVVVVFDGHFRDYHPPKAWIAQINNPLVEAEAAVFLPAPPVQLATAAAAAMTNFKVV